jgi:hypothetical protein
MRATSSSLPTSATTVATFVPCLPSSLANWSRAPPLRAASTRLAPCLAAMRAVVSPIPLVAPVITMVCWLSFFSRIVMIWLSKVR